MSAKYVSELKKNALINKAMRVMTEESREQFTSER